MFKQPYIVSIKWMVQSCTVIQMIIKYEIHWHLSRYYHAVHDLYSIVLFCEQDYFTPMLFCLLVLFELRFYFSSVLPGNRPLLSTCTVSCKNQYQLYRGQTHLYQNIINHLNMYGFDIELVYSLLVIIPCFIIILFWVWTRMVAKNQAKILSEQLNE